MTDLEISELLGRLSQIETELNSLASKATVLNSEKRALQQNIAKHLNHCNCVEDDLVTIDGGGKIFRVVRTYNNDLTLERAEIKTI